MKRFINLDHQLQLDKLEPKQFSFFCTVKCGYESFSGVSVWDNINDFIIDYSKHGGNEINRYLNLIPDEFKKNTFTKLGPNTNVTC